MTMKYTLILILAAIQSLANPGKRILELKNNASMPRFTTDERGRTVLSWVEKQGEKASFFYSVSADGGQTFSDKIRVPVLPGVSVHAEGMPKVAFKSDGTVLALFEVKKPTADAPRASDLLFMTSKDGGKTWTDARPVHRDATPGKGHSFADVQRLPSGELGIVWLDEKMKKYEGRSVKFVQTGPGGFSPEIVLDSNACQCCRTTLAHDAQGRIFVAYRDLLPDGSRDVSYVVSGDGGRSFGPPQRVYADNWKIQACPHSGPQFAATPTGMQITWYSGVDGSAGVRLARLDDGKLLHEPTTSNMKFPQVAALPDGHTALVWSEWVGEAPDTYQKIGLKVGTQVQYLTPPGDLATYPTVTAAGDGLLVAWQQLVGTSTQIVVCRL